MRTPRYKTQRVKHRALILQLLKEHGPMTYHEIHALQSEMTLQQVYFCVDNAKQAGLLVSIVPGGARKAAVVGLPGHECNRRLENVFQAWRAA